MVSAALRDNHAVFSAGHHAGFHSEPFAAHHGCLGLRQMIALFEREFLLLGKPRIPSFAAPRPRLGEGFLGPRLPALGHVGKTFWLCLRKIVQLSAIGINVVQFPRAISALGNELPFALAHGAVAFVLPIDRLFTINVLAVKGRRKRGALQRHDCGVAHHGRVLGAAEIDAGGHEIYEVARLAFQFAITRRVNALGPMGGERGTDTAFVHPVFVFAEGRVTSISPSQTVAVIGIIAAGHHLGALLHHAAIAGTARDHVKLQVSLAHGFELFGILIAVLNPIASAHALGAAAVVSEEEDQRVVVFACVL